MKFMTKLFLSNVATALLILGTHTISDSFAETSNTAPAPTEFIELAVYPSNVSLDHREDFQNVVAVATRADGMTLDVTKLANWRLQPADTGVAFHQGKLTATSNQQVRLCAEFAGLEGTAEVNAHGIEQQLPVSYRHDVIPILVRSGCNAGACHGASRGKDGFRLSLFGFDPAGDHQRLTRELVNRRLNLAIPEESLLLKKATGSVPHTGGKRFEKDSVYYNKLRQWIADGAKNDLEGAPTVSSVELYPPKAAIGANGQQQQFVVTARYSDGTTRDVTHLAVFQSNNESSAAIDSQGVVTSDRRGEAFVMARFDTHTVGSQVLVLPTGQPFEPIEEEPANYIDELVGEKLRTLRINPSPLASDKEFLRRVTIDIAGRLPTREEQDTFLADQNPEKRAAKIDELLAGPEFPKLWGLKWSELLLVRTEVNRVDYKPMFLYSQWLTEQIAKDRPLDEMVRDLLSASGTSFDNPAVNFYQVEPDAKKIAENVAQAFLGIRIQCAQCHNHPFDRWTMDDYYAFTGFFTQIARKRGEDYREWMVYDRSRGEAKHPVDGKTVPPKFLGGEKPDFGNRDRRAVLADWIVDPENPYFGVSVANRVWAHFMGRGIVEPVDDIRISNPPVNPKLFDTLGTKFVEYDYNLRELVRDICNSRTYQRSARPNESNATDTANFARAQPRRIPAEVLLDCLCQATNAPEKLPGLPLGSRAVEIADGKASNYFLTTFGRAKRETVCACESKTEPTLSQALHLINGRTVHNKIAEGQLVKRWLDAGKTPEEIIEQIYVRCLSRLPTDEEKTEFLESIPQDTPAKDPLEDIFWAVLNSREFIFNH